MGQVRLTLGIAQNLVAVVEQEVASILQATAQEGAVFSEQVAALLEQRQTVTQVA